MQILRRHAQKLEQKPSKSRRAPGLRKRDFQFIDCETKEDRSDDLRERVRESVTSIVLRELLKRKSEFFDDNPQA